MKTQFFKIYEKKFKNAVKRALPDKLYLKIMYRKIFGRKLNLHNPQTFNEKLNWFKLYDRKDVYTRLADKYEAKKYVGDLIGYDHVVPTIMVANSFSDIHKEQLPDKFVIKTTHDSGGVVICKDKSAFDFDDAKRKIERSMRNNFYWQHREWQYKNIQPRIIVEEFLEEKGQETLEEYKFFCFDGVIRMVLVCKGIAHTDLRTNDYCDVELTRYPFTSLLPNSVDEMRKPACYHELLEYVRVLAKGFSQVRIDMYVINDRVFFGEFTFTHNAGMTRFEPDEWDYTIGQWYKLPGR